MTLYRWDQGVYGDVSISGLVQVVRTSVSGRPKNRTSMPDKEDQGQSLNPNFLSLHLGAQFQMPSEYHQAHVWAASRPISVRGYVYFRAATDSCTATSLGSIDYKSSSWISCQGPVLFKGLFKTVCLLLNIKPIVSTCSKNMVILNCSIQQN